MLARTVIVAVLFWTSTSTTASIAAAQSAGGDIQGTIVDTAGVVLPGVTVTITNTATGAMREVFTDDIGAFSAPVLPVGPYEVQASFQGFATRRQPDLMLQVGQVITLRLELGVAQSPETITVAGTPPMPETTRTQVSSIISSTEIEHVPVRDRNAVSFAPMAPGVTRDRPFNRILWDGHERGHLLAGPHWISQEATQSVRVSTNTYTAEYGRALGEIIEVVTKSGSNELNGSAFGMKGNGANQFGGSMGGPLARNRHFAYGIYDDLRYAPEHDQRLFLARTDHQLSDMHRLSLRYTSEEWRIGREAAAFADGSAHGFGATATSALGSALMNEARFHAGRDREAIELVGDASVNHFQFADTLTWLRGAHKLKAGFDMDVDRSHTGEYSLFAQDEWQIDPEITVNVGMRYDAQTVSGLDAIFRRSDYNNFGPRLGVAWAPVGRTFVVRGGYGIVHGQAPWRIAASPPAIEAEYRTPRVQQASTGFDWEWMPNTAVSMHYLMLRRSRLPEAGTPSRYDGVTMELTRRFAQGHQYRLSYTLSNADGQVFDAFEPGRHRFTGSVIVSSNRIADRFSGLLESAVKDWTLSGIYTAQSRGASSAPSWISLDPRLARDIDLKRGTRVTLLWEAFNLLGRSNQTVWNPMYDLLGTQPHIDRRTTQVAARFSF